MVLGDEKVLHKTSKGEAAAMHFQDDGRRNFSFIYKLVQTSKLTGDGNQKKPIAFLS
jgi:hypothetical protein